MLGTVKSAGLYGIEAYPVEVEVNINKSDFGHVALVGLPDAAVKESRDLRSMLAVSGEQLDRPVLHDWIERRGLQAEWKLVSG